MIDSWLNTLGTLISESVWLAPLLALLAGILLAWRGGSLFLVAVACCLVVFVSEWFLI